jgi:hypothetical protein
VSKGIPSPLNILFTNNTLAGRAGTELYIRDLAFALSKRGHQVAAYSNVLGEVAEELIDLGVPVSDDLAGISFMPEILHLHHHLEAMTALRRFPGVPAVYFCHGWRSWQEIPHNHPRILEYAVVDLPTGKSACVEHGIPTEKIRLMLNFVDLERFKPRGPLPEIPRKALIFSNYANEKTHLPPIREACKRKNILLEVAGTGVGNYLSKPEEVLGSFDLIFAKGRAALESMAVGASVILCDELGLGPMIKYADFNRLRILNFGSKTFTLSLTPENIIKEIEKHDPDDASLVSRHVRSVCGLDRYVDSVLSLYQGLIDKFKQIEMINPMEEIKAEVNYLNWASRLLKHKDRTVVTLQYALTDTQTVANQIITERDLLKIELDATRKELRKTQDVLSDAQHSLPIQIRNRLLRMPGTGPLLRKITPVIKKYF